MSATKLQEGLYAVGVLNPNMRIFDVVMETQWGTSYNAYLVQGKEKTALIEVCHKDFFDQFLSNIRQVTDPSAIDYIILNHCEPDHSGALAALLELCPQAQIVVSKGGSLYLKNITNRADLPFMIAKDQDVLNLGGLELRFIAAPFLHWPDSMFTYWQQEKIAFTCDFLGAHYCEPYLWDRYIAYPKSYRQAFEYYYQGIFGPFKPYVLAGLEKLAALELTTVCPSHGPVLTRQGYLEEAMACYHTWSLPDENQKPELAVFYCSAYGNTAQLGQAIAKGAKSQLPAWEVNCYDLNEQNLAEMSRRLNQAKAIAIGSPTINGDAVAPVWQLLSHVDAVNNKKKPALVFGSYGWSGEAVPNLTARLQGLKMALFGDGLKVTFVPSAADLVNAEALGAEFAKSFL